MPPLSGVEYFSVQPGPFGRRFSGSVGFQAKSDVSGPSYAFYTGIARDASSVLTKQRANMEKQIRGFKKMSDSVFEFRDKLIAGDFEGLGKMLHEGWMLKKTLASNVSNPIIDSLYTAGLNAGAWGGKILGAGGGSSVLFIAPLDKKPAIRQAMQKAANTHQLQDFNEIPFSFVQSGGEILMNNDNTFKVREV